jgi:hypothetical protein
MIYFFYNVGMISNAKRKRFLADRAKLVAKSLPDANDFVFLLKNGHTTT